MFSKIFAIKYLSKKLLCDNNNVIKLLSTYNKHTNSENIRQDLCKNDSYTESSTKQNSGQQMFKTNVTKLNKKFKLGENIIADPEKERGNLLNTFPNIVCDLIEYLKLNNANEDMIQRFSNCLEYNVKKGRKNRAIGSVLLYKALVDKAELTHDNLKIIYLLGWCIEMMHAALLIRDDIIDGGITRRGKLCWYKYEDVKLNAINDATMIENGLFYMLKKYFQNKNYYVKLIEIFNDVMFKTNIGQTMDAIMSSKHITEFSLDEYITCAKLKGLYYSITLPITIAMIVSGYNDINLINKTNDTLLNIGLYYQIRNDFIDWYHDSDFDGKIGNDIEENKYTWFAIMGMERANPEQKQILIDCYGQNDSDKVAKVKQLYKELGLIESFKNYENKTFNNIKSFTKQTSKHIPHHIYLRIMENIYCLRVFNDEKLIV